MVVHSVGTAVAHLVKELGGELAVVQLVETEVGCYATTY